jgi:hypothetical protein
MAGSYPAKYNQQFYRGDTYWFPFIYKTGAVGAEVPTSVLGQSWRFTVRHKTTDAILMEASVGNGINLQPPGIVDDATGLVEILIQPAYTNIEVGTHKYDIQQTANGKTFTKIVGEFIVKEDESR